MAAVAGPGLRAAVVLQRGGELFGGAALLRLALAAGRANARVEGQVEPVAHTQARGTQSDRRLPRGPERGCGLSAQED